MAAARQAPAGGAIPTTSTPRIQAHIRRSAWIACQNRIIRTVQAKSLPRSAQHPAVPVPDYVVLVHRLVRQPLAQFAESVNTKGNWSPEPNRIQMRYSEI